MKIVANENSAILQVEVEIYLAMVVVVANSLNISNDYTNLAINIDTIYEHLP